MSTKREEWITLVKSAGVIGVRVEAFPAVAKANKIRVRKLAGLKRLYYCREDVERVAREGYQIAFAGELTKV